MKVSMIFIIMHKRKCVKCKKCEIRNFSHVIMKIGNRIVTFDKKCKNMKKKSCANIKICIDEIRKI